jgi:hypothetical protein
LLLVVGAEVRLEVHLIGRLVVVAELVGIEHL